MKVSVSLPDSDVAFLDSYARAHRERSRSAAVHAAVRLLRATELASAYAGAWEEWAATHDNERWDAAVADGVMT